MRKEIILLVICLWMISCSTPRYIYSPSAQNIPVLVKAGDSKLAANYSNNISGGRTYDNNYSGRTEVNKSYGYDLQAAVAVTNNFAVQANLFYRKEQNGDYSTTLRYKRRLTELGIGYFKSFKRKRKTVIFQVFGGVGFGKFNLNDNGEDYNGVPYSRFHNDDIFKVYVQPAIIFKIRENLNISVSSRLSFVNYNNIQTNYTTDELRDYELSRLSYTNFAFWEPSFTQSFGIKSVPGLLLEYQFGLSLPLTQGPINYHPLNFSVGLAFDIPKLFRAGNKAE